MSDEETLLVSSDGSASDDDDTTDRAQQSALETHRNRRPGQTPLVDHASLVRQMKQQQANREQDATINPSIYRMSKYEYSRLKGARLEQLQRGAIPCVAYDDLDKESVYTIFRREFLTGRVPLTISRDMPDGSSQELRVRDFVDRDSTAYD